MLACAQAIHSTADILAHAVYYIVDPDKSGDRLSDNDIRLDTVVKRLRRGAGESLTVGEILGYLDSLKANEAFQDVAHVVNQTKHRGGPKATLAIQPAEGKAFEMRFSDYFREVHRPAMEYEELLAPAFLAVNRTVVDVGIAMNNFLGEKNRRQ